MEKFATFTGKAVPLRRSNVDTDQIVPSVFLKRVTRSGFSDALFAEWRKDPRFVLNDPRFQDSSILVTGPDFGTGSSREHAVWALQDYGFRVVISSRFADIFRNNAGKVGLLAIKVSELDAHAILDEIEAANAQPVAINLEKQFVSTQSKRYDFEIDPYLKWKLLEGYDDIALTERHEDAITAFEKARPSSFPTTVKQ